jgi:hypothetical protein
MAQTLKFEDYNVIPINLEREVNYVIFKNEEYMFRLVPGYSGFELSPHDKTLGIEPDLHLIAKISDFIVRQDD